jgi:hypothetical protein
MVERPYFGFGAHELESEVKKSWDSVPALQGILSELKHRTTARAQRLERDVVARLLALGSSAEHTGRSGPDKTDGATLRDLSSRAIRAEQQVRELQERLDVAEAELARVQSADTDDSEGLYRQVGLHPLCPDFILKVVRRTFRKEYHPDALSDRPKDEQLAAQERFKEYERIFAEIEKLRE